MSPYQPWQPGGVRVQLGDITLDSTIPCGNGHDFREVGEGHVRFRARVGRANYAWRYYFRIDSPGDGREVLLEVADLNHFGQELWQEQATVISTDGVTWTDVGLDRMAIVPHTPTGVPELDDTADDGRHPPYGVQMRLRLDSPTVYLATPTPYTPAHSRDHLHALARRCNFFHVEEIGRSRHHDSHGFPLLMCRVTKGGDASERLRVFVVAGEHPSESAGMYAAEGLLEEILRTHDLLDDFDFWVVPIVNVDGVVFGKSYYNVAPDPADVGVNLARDWTDRTQPETQAVWRVLEQVQPHCVLSLHNGRHRREYEAWAPPHPGLATMMDALREHLPVPLQHWRPDTPGMLTHEVSRVPASPRVPASLRDALSLCFETLLLRKLPGCATFSESYRRTGMALARGLVAGLRDLQGHPRMLAQREPLATTPLRLKAADFVAQLPSLYYDRDCAQLHDHSRRSFEANGLPLPPGHYDVHLRMQPDQTLRLSEEPNAPAYFSAPGWRVLPSFPLPARLLSFDFDADGDDLPFTEVVITPEGLPLETALDAAVPYDRYVRDTLADTRPHFRDWAPFYARLRQGGFGADDLQAMHDEIVDWAAGRQVLDEGDPHYGAVYSEEDKYDGRDAAAAAACFTRRWRLTGDDEWRQRALLARAYTYRLQRHEPGNPAHDGGFVHMVHGTWGVNFTRLEPPWPGIDGVDTSLVVHQLCRAADLGLPLDDTDCEVLTQAAQWLRHSEALPGMFLHHEGATHDCQNANALGLSALVRITHTLAQPGRGVATGDGDPAAWLAAAARGLDHYLSGQEAIGVWPYHFAMVGRRAGQYHFSNIPDHGIGLSHLTRVAHLAPLCDHPGLLPALRRAACWYLGVSGLDGDTTNLDYDRRPDLGDDICFAGFTWCRFTAAATLLRIARLTGETEPWRSLALRLMEHVRRHLWQRDDPSHAPVVAHARPEARLATWCQAAEWNASMLSEMIEDLQEM